MRVRFKRVDPGYFHTLDIPVLAGRGITDHDREGSPRVIVINQALAARLADVAGMKEPVGKKVRLSSTDYLGQTPVMLDVEIAGIIEASALPRPAIRIRLSCTCPWPSRRVATSTCWSAPGKRAPPSCPQFVMRSVKSIQSAACRRRQMRQVRDRTLSGASRPAWLIGAFAFLAVLLAAIGLYGVASYSATQQRRELGIRIALGARREDVLAHVLRVRSP